MGIAVGVVGVAVPVGVVVAGTAFEGALLRLQHVVNHAQVDPFLVKVDDVLGLQDVDRARILDLRNDDFGGIPGLGKLENVFCQIPEISGNASDADCPYVAEAPSSMLSNADICSPRFPTVDSPYPLNQVRCVRRLLRHPQSRRA